MKIKRRDWLIGAGTFVGTALLGDNVLAAAKRKSSKRKASNHKRSPRRRGVKSVRVTDSGPLPEARLYEDVIAYYNLGEHRTATEADLKTSQWLAEQLRAAGLKATFQSFDVRQFFTHQTRLLIGDRSIRAFPLWFPRSTGPTPINSEIALFDKNVESRPLRGRIALIRFPFDARAAVFEGSGHAEVIQATARAGASAVVAITEGPTQEIIAFNVLPGAEPWPIPVALASPRDEAALMAATRSGAKASVLIDGEDDREARAKNVLARVDRGKDLIVISTPQSGWFRCAAERGPGIALFLGLARWASRRTSGASFLFVSTSGHELGGLGMKAFLKELAPSPDRVLCWLHLGAGIAAYSWEETATGPKRLREPDSKRSLMASPDLVPILTSAFADVPGLTPSNRAVGEFEFIIKAGYRTFGIAAAHRFHHTPADSPEMTGPEILEPVGRALVKSIESIEGK